MKSLGQQLVKSQQELQSRCIGKKLPRGQTSGRNIAGLNSKSVPFRWSEEWKQMQRRRLRKESIHANLGTAMETIEVLQQDQSARQDGISDLTRGQGCVT
jgi:hypothetical protein